jgi:hypothetical protein
MQEQLAKNLFVHYTLRDESSAAKCWAISRPKVTMRTALPELLSCAPFHTAS